VGPWAFSTWRILHACRLDPVPFPDLSDSLLRAILCPSWPKAGTSAVSDLKECGELPQRVRIRAGKYRRCFGYCHLKPWLLRGGRVRPSSRSAR
jgi:hypothetical protein